MGENGKQKGKRGEADVRKLGDQLPHHNKDYQSNRGYRNPGASQHPSTNGGGGYRSQTNTRGEKRCYLYGRWGHLQYGCPNKRGTQESEKKAMFAGACDDVAWNEDSYKDLKQGTLNGRRVQMLVDTGSDKTIVAAGVKGVALNSEKVPVYVFMGTCVHILQHTWSWKQMDGSSGLKW